MSGRTLEQDNAPSIEGVSEDTRQKALEAIKNGDLSRLEGVATDEKERLAAWLLKVQPEKSTTRGGTTEEILACSDDPLSQEEQQCLDYLEEVRDRLLVGIEKFPQDKDQALNLIRDVEACRHKIVAELKQLAENAIQEWEKGIEDAKAALDDGGKWAREKTFQEAKKTINLWHLGPSMGINNLVRADFKQRVVKLITEAPYDLDDLEDVDELLGVFDLKAMGPELVDRYCNDVEILIERVVDPSLPRGREAKVVEVLNYGVAYKASGDTYERAKVRSGGFPGS